MAICQRMCGEMFVGGEGKLEPENRDAEEESEHSFL